MTPAERAAEAACLALQPSTVALTLTWNEFPVSRDRIRRDLRALHSRVDRQLLGRRFFKYPPEKRSQFWAVPEKLDGYPHCHLGWHLPSGGDDKLDDILRCQWPAIAKGGGHDLRQPHAAWPRYACKALADPHDIIYSTEFLAAR